VVSRKKKYYNWILNCNRLIREREISQFQNDIVAVSCWHVDMSNT